MEVVLYPNKFEIVLNEEKNLLLRNVSFSKLFRYTVFLEKNSSSNIEVKGKWFDIFLIGISDLLPVII